MRSIFLTFLLLGFFRLYSQTGNYFLSHFSPTEKRFDNVCFDIVQDDQGLLFFATRKGVLQYDGKNWDPIPGNGAIYSLMISRQGSIFWSGASGYGVVGKDKQGFTQLKTISSPGATEVFQCLEAGERIYFLNEESLFVITEKSDTIIIKSSSPTGLFIGMTEIFGKIYLNAEQGIFKVDGNKLVPSLLGFSTEDEILFATTYQNTALIGLANGKIFICGENLIPHEIHLEDQTYADASVVVSGCWVNRDLFVVGTLRGGMIFVNAATGKTQQIINYATGLPDNEVYAMMSDNSQSIWSAHEYGFTRVSPYLPFRSFSHYTGLQGNLLCAISFDKNVYVGTSLGLFKLEKEELYDIITYYVDTEIKGKKVEPAGKKSSGTENGKKNPPQEVEPKKKSFLGFLKRNRSKTNDQRSEPTTEPGSGTEVSTFREKKTDKILRKSHYVYKKVKGIDAKITQLINAKGHLLAAGLGGVFEVKNLLSTSLLEEPVRSVFAPPNQEMVFISTYKNEMRTLAVQQKSWKLISVLDKVDDHITSMFEGANNDFWLCAIDKVYRLQISGDKISTIQNIAFENPNFDNIEGMRWGSKIILVTSRGFFEYDKTKEFFNQIDSLASPLQYFAGEKSIWFRDFHSWNLIGENPGERNLHLLNLYKDLRFIAPDENPENLWIITGNNEFYKFFGEKFTPFEVGYPVLLKSVHNNDQRISTQGKLSIEENNATTFQVVKPDYFAPQSIEYRYQLEGLDQSWSEWSGAFNTINFPYLPAGDYALHIEAKDIFGKVNELHGVSFEVLPPYWKRPWFYALEFIIFALLVILSFRLSARFRLISRVLSLLTIILLIQFIQTIIGETFEKRESPVVDFFMQVLIAFLILPVEGYLRNLMLKSLDQNSKLYKLITLKANGKPNKHKQEL